ncbi:four-helix bundle copper-binding protein [Nitrosomonas ureae]|uniref:Four-helix bundle copper-binding protein n=1 Tax=Nitrosomonas ureae TaxID=44577 RepID=A0A286ABD9_9PROT|nr:four-helix bundle copper-binding protein [Nitrosomonas ureae]SOD19221.1 hypothetical protein SAMN06297164_2194 [Nitrosomonas ureae]
MNHSTYTKHDMQACIAACTRCYQICLHMGMNHCLEAGGKHVESTHFRLLMSCAEICQTSANFMLSGAAHSSAVCAICAEICEACAIDCEKIGDMAQCVEACRDCAETCKQMASMRH